ncbi:MAG: (Fe-S)-binding protein [Promethearchaeota archaeon]
MAKYIGRWGCGDGSSEILKGDQIMIELDKLSVNTEYSDSDLSSLISECIQCGVCTSVCPKRHVSKYNPRMIIHSALLGHTLSMEDLTDCLTCSECFEYCPQMIDFPKFIREYRTKVVLNEENFAHHNIFNLLQIFMTQMTESGLSFQYEGEIDAESRTAYFPGCIDLFDRFLDLQKTDFHQIGQSAINIMNKAGIKPNLISLKCCGHDAYWTGDNDTFEKIRDYNTQIIRNSGISTLVVSCAECYYSFEELYKLEGIKIQHITQFIEEQQTTLPFKEEKGIVTYHDACRLGRFMKEYDSPRSVLKNTGTTIMELENNKENCTCCGVSAWLKCDDRARAIMLQKLDEATRTGASTLVVGCTKCFAHLNCILEDKEPQHNYQILVKEIGTFLDGLITGK